MLFLSVFLLLPIIILDWCEFFAHMRIQGTNRETYFQNQLKNANLGEKWT